MIIKALAYIETAKFRSPWRYIMVDEFQDISEPRARLVKALRDSNKETSQVKAALCLQWAMIGRQSTDLVAQMLRKGCVAAHAPQTGQCLSTCPFLVSATRQRHAFPHE